MVTEIKNKIGCFVFCAIMQTVIQFSSVAQSCQILCDPMSCSTPSLPVHHQLPEFTQTHVHQVSDAIQGNASQNCSELSLHITRMAIIYIYIRGEKGKL